MCRLTQSAVSNIARLLSNVHFCHLLQRMQQAHTEIMQDCTGMVVPMPAGSVCMLCVQALSHTMMRVICMWLMLSHRALPSVTHI
jgi:hypothetical protein